MIFPRFALIFAVFDVVSSPSLLVNFPVYVMHTIAILADLHLPERTDTVKEAVFDWALQEARRQGAQLIAGAGDLTSLGTIGAARRVVAKMTATGLPVLNAPGNAEWRYRQQTADVLALMTPNQRLENVVTLDIPRQVLTPQTLEFLQQLRQQGQKNLLAIAHCPLPSLSIDDQILLDTFIEDGVIGCFIAGHKHRDADEHPYHSMRGLDPDKAIGGPPALVVMRLDSQQRWTRTDIPCPLATPTSWSADIRHDFLQYLGISGMNDTRGALEDAIRHHVPALEIRYEATLSRQLDELRAQLAVWRQHGGRFLSLHAPDITRDAMGIFHGQEQLHEAACCAVALGCDAVTLHTPAKHPVSSIIGYYKERLLGEYQQALQPLVEAQIPIGIENMHLTANEHLDAHRGYGYTPDECRDWILALRRQLNYERIGFHLDIGHARNNARIASRYNLSEWYAELGTLLTGCHLHQVAPTPDGKMQNHCRFDSLYGQFISLSSFLMAWRDNQLRHVPLFLEIRNDRPLHSLQTLRQLLA